MVKKLLIIAIAVIALLPLRTVYAQDTTTTAQSYTADARTARISELRQKFRISLSEKEKEIVSARCQEAQKNLQKIRTNVDVTHTKRSNAYASAISLLTSLSALFQKAQIDSSNLDLLIVSYQQKKSLFEDSIIQYETHLDDTIALECTTQPEDFRASLEGVREARKNVVTISADIQETTRASLKTTLDSLRLRLSTEGR